MRKHRLADGIDNVQSDLESTSPVGFVKTKKYRNLLKFQPSVEAKFTLLAQKV